MAGLKNIISSPLTLDVLSDRAEMSSSVRACFFSSRTFPDSSISLAWLLIRLKFCFKYVTNNQLEFIIISQCVILLLCDTLLIMVRIA